VGERAGDRQHSGAPAYRIVRVRHDWERFGEVLDLCYRILYEPYCVPRDGDWYHEAYGSEFAIALAESGAQGAPSAADVAAAALPAVLGTARLIPAPGDTERQVRQVTVVPEARLCGIGAALMAELERMAREEGASELWLHARETAYGFYEALGFVAEGHGFVSDLTGIPHTTMRKHVG
jgi:GNAT superfamily N-acetyltransferase